MTPFDSSEDNYGRQTYPHDDASVHTLTGTEEKVVPHNPKGQQCRCDHGCASSAAMGAQQQHRQAGLHDQSSWGIKSVVLGAIQGCSVAAASLALIRATIITSCSSTTAAANLSAARRSTVLCGISGGLALGFAAATGLYYHRCLQDFERSRQAWVLENNFDGSRGAVTKAHQTVDQTAMMIEEVERPRNSLPLTTVVFPLTTAFMTSFFIPHIPFLCCCGEAGCSSSSSGPMPLQVGEVVLAAQTVAVSILQSSTFVFLLFGERSKTTSTLQVTFINTAWIAGVFGLATTFFRVMAPTNSL